MAGMCLKIDNSQIPEGINWEIELIAMQMFVVSKAQEKRLFEERSQSSLSILVFVTKM